MKISEVIKVLEHAQKEVGDVEFIVNTEVDGQFCLELGREVALIEIDLEGDGKEVPVVAVLNFDTDQVEEL